MIIQAMAEANKKTTVRASSPGYIDGQVVGILENGMIQIKTINKEIKTSKSGGGQKIGDVVSVMGGLLTGIPGRLLHGIEEVEITL